MFSVYIAYDEIFVDNDLSFHIISVLRAEAHPFGFYSSSYSMNDEK